MRLSYHSSLSYFVFGLVFLTSAEVRSGDLPDQLELKDSGKKIENKIELQISNAEYSRLKGVDGKRVYLTDPEAEINGEKVAVKGIHTRGKTSLYYRRKSLSFSMDKKITFTHGKRSVSLKKFKAISLSMDRNYMRNRMAFELMEKIQLFGLFYTYCELQINNHSEGIYLVVEQPEDWAIKKAESPLVMRRGFDHKIEKITLKDEDQKLDSKKYKGYYNSIYQTLREYEGEELYTVLSQWLDLDMYMTWLAFNFFVRNGDYTDEVYFYIDPKDEKYRIVPWDYDDIFASAPHEGMKQKKYEIGDKFIFSSEDRLDQAIANDQYLYEKYLFQLRKVLEELSVEFLKAAFESIYSELYPYYVNEDVIAMSEYDAHKVANLESLENDLNTIFNQLVLSRQIYMDNPEP